jgi:hypothetical protein
MFGFALLAFLLLAVVIAVAVFFAFKSGEQGKTKLGGFAGCLIALALLVIAGMGAIATMIVAAVSIPGEAMRHGPVRSFEWHWNSDDAPDAPHAADSDAAFRVRVELRGTADNQSVMRWIRKNTDERTMLSVHEETDSKGEPCTVIDITPRLDVRDKRDLREIFESLQRDLPELKLPAGGRIEIKDPDEH